MTNIDDTTSCSPPGAAIARELARQGFTVVLVARSRERLERVLAAIQEEGGRGEVMVCDMASK